MCDNLYISDNAELILLNLDNKSTPTSSILYEIAIK